MKTRWGIDLGGTKIEGIVIREDNHEVLARLRIPTESHLGYDHIISQIARLVSLLEKETGIKANRLGICTPGTEDRDTGRMKNCNTTSLNGKNLKFDLQSTLHQECILANDANCFALAETKMGIIAEKYPEAEVVFGMILGTGAGGGIVINGNLINGRHGIAGEWGHNFLDESGGDCYCGQTGCVETILSGTAIQKYYKKISHSDADVKQITELYRQGNEYAVSTMDRFFHFFGKATAQMINILDPDVIVIGGGVGNTDELYTKGVENVKPFIFNHTLHTAFVKPKSGDSAGVFGAAFLHH